MPQFRYLVGQCTFPWLLANVLDPALGDQVPLGNARTTVMLTASNGIKIGVIGLVEREWLDTINSLPPNLKYLSASATAQELCPKLREQGAEIIVAVTHAREPNDVKLAEKTPDGLIDLILGGHDHFYGHSIVNGKHLLRSGTDFKQLSHIKAWKKKDDSGKWDFDIVRRDVVQEIPEDKATLELVEKLTAQLKTKLEKPIGYTLAPLDARFTTVRLKESNIGNFVCDLMRLHYSADCALMAAGTIRGDQIYPSGVLKLKDIMNWYATLFPRFSNNMLPINPLYLAPALTTTNSFPFEDPVIVISLPGSAILSALENAVSIFPALEGRFPQVSNITFSFNPIAPPHSRIRSVSIAGSPLSPTRTYKLATRGYMGRGKDGFTSLLVKSEGGHAEEIVSEENGILISMILRQYFMSLKVLGRWKRWGRSMGRHWEGVCGELHGTHPVRESAPASPVVVGKRPPGDVAAAVGVSRDHVKHPEVDSESEDDGDFGPNGTGAPATSNGTTYHPHPTHENHDHTLAIMRKVMRKWQRIAGVTAGPGLGEEGGEFTVGWTRGIAPRLEGRIREVEF